MNVFIIILWQSVVIQILFVFFPLVRKFPGDDPRSEGIAPHFLIVNTDGEIDDFASHVVLHSLGRPVVIGEGSSGSQIGNIALGEDVQPLAEAGAIISVFNIQVPSNIFHRILDRDSHIIAEI